MVYKERYKEFVLQQKETYMVLYFINIFGGRFGLFRYDLLLNDVKDYFEIKNHKAKIDELITLGLLLTITIDKKKYVYMNSKSYGFINNIEKGIKISTPNSFYSYDVWNMKYKTYHRIKREYILKVMGYDICQNFTNTKSNIDFVKAYYKINNDYKIKQFDRAINYFKATNTLFCGDKDVLFFYCIFTDTENSYWYDALKRNFDKVIQEIIDFTEFLEVKRTIIYIMIDSKNKAAFEKIHKPLITSKKNYALHNNIIRFVYV